MAEAAAPQVFTRRASGLVRVMSPYSAFIYNVLTMGVIFPWTYLWAPTAFQGSNLVAGILFAFLFELPIALAYAWLATALPRSGGDYVFQSRVFGGGFGFTVVFAFFVVWILQWVALSGWLMASLGIAPTFIGLGVTTGVSAFTDIGTWAASANGIIIISVVNAGVALVLLVSGFRNYVRFQFVMWYAILISFGLVLLLFLTTNPTAAQVKLDGFASSVDGISGFFATARGAAEAAGVNFNPPFWLFGTLMVAPIAWTSLQWATYSVEQGGEVKNAHVFRNQVFILVGSLTAVAGLLVLLALAMQKGIGTEGILTASAGYWYAVPEATIGGNFMFPNLMAMGLTGSWVIVLLIGLGFILNSFQIVCNCYIGTTRIMVAQGLDGLLPDWFSRVSPKFKTPVNAHIAYFLAALPVIYGFNKVSSWTRWTLGVTFANGAVMVISALAAALLPYRAKAVYEASPGARYKIGNLPTVTLVGVLGFLLGGFMVLSFLFVPELGLAYSIDGLPYFIVLGTAAFGLIVYFVMRSVQAKKGLKVEYAFQEIPPE
ncbi:MAG: amino acid permease [Actinomycetota bacterium]|nr:amino acid permease [Actinomycetota bacterium]MDH5312558.1 amino acid permease [Actinomycetota bacterium]